MRSADVHTMICFSLIKFQVLVIVKKSYFTFVEKDRHKEVYNRAKSWLSTRSACYVSKAT